MNGPRSLFAERPESAGVRQRAAAPSFGAVVVGLFLWALVAWALFSWLPVLVAAGGFAVLLLVAWVTTRDRPPAPGIDRPPSPRVLEAIERGQQRQKELHRGSTRAPILLALCIPPLAMLYAPEPPARSLRLDVTAVLVAPGDTQRVFCRWDPPAPDGLGGVDLYNVTWSTTPATSGYPLSRQFDAGRRMDSVRVPLPPLPGSVIVTCAVQGTRQGALGAVASVSLTLRRPVVPLPPPTNIRIDTVAVFTVGPFALMAPARSFVACAKGRVSGRWYLGEPAALFDGVNVPLPTFAPVFRTWLGDPAPAISGYATGLTIAASGNTCRPIAAADPAMPWDSTLAIVDWR